MIVVIGKYVKQRMEDLEFKEQYVSEKSGFSLEEINAILNDEVTFDTDDFEPAVLANILMCEPEYFFCQEAREKDVITQSYNRGPNTVGSNLIKAKMQSFVRDYLLASSSF